MLKTSFAVILFSFYSIQVTAQSNLEMSLNSLGRAASESFSWKDIPGGILLLSAKFFPVNVNDKLDVHRFSFDQSINTRVRIDGSNSLGSINPGLYPETVFLTRVALTTAGGLLMGADPFEGYKHSFVFYKAVMYNVAITELVKNLTYRERPDGSDDRSFFSGHTSVAFVTSAFLFQEVNSYINKSISSKTTRLAMKTTSFATLYGWAGYVGYSRMRDNKHYFSDVVIGAAVGTLIGIYFHNLYFNEEPGIFDNISLGVINNQPTVNFTLQLN